MVYNVKSLKSDLSPKKSIQNLEGAEVNSDFAEAETDYNFISAPEIVGSFQDVLKSAWYADSVKWAVDKTITAGTSDTTFSPATTCTRGQIVTFLWRAA